MMVDKIHKKGGMPNRGVALAGGDPNEAVSRKLKLLYTTIEEEGIPDRFLDLLERLDLAEQAGSPRTDR